MNELFRFLAEPGFPLFAAGSALVYLLLDATLRLYDKPEPELTRWRANFLLYVTNYFVAYSFLFFFDYRVENEAASSPFGLFATVTGVPFLIQLLAYALLLDFLVYWLHRFSHYWIPLWRLHLVHHSDKDLDFTDSFRFHPLERVLDIPLITISAVLLGVELDVLLAYNLLYTMFVFFPHANMKVNSRVDRWIRLILVTPDMHRIHHMMDMRQTNSNYGDIFSFWDRFFGTYQDIPADEQVSRQLGLEYFRAPKDQGFVGLLLQPFLYRKPANLKGQTVEQQE